VSDKLLAALKRHNPARVRAYSGDDDFREIAVPTRRQRWTVVIAAIVERSWSRCELLDKGGAVLGYCNNTEPAGVLEDLAPAGGAIKEAERIVALVIKAQRDAMTFRDAEVTNLLKAQGDVVREMTAGMRALTAMYAEQVQAAEQVAELRTMAANPERGQLAELLEAAPHLLQMLPAIRQLLSGREVTAPAPPPESNGVS